jgi:hypothetical protein
MRLTLCLAACLCLPPLLPAAEAPKWKAGVAAQVITPKESIWLAGYGSRTKPSEGKEHDLYVKALALEDPDGNRVVVVTSDLIGIPRSLAVAVAKQVEKKTKLPRERLMITCSHTHCSPALADNLLDMYPMPPEEAKKIAPYTEKVTAWMVGVVVKAIESLKPATLEVGQGTAGFAMNRRKKTDKGFINAANPDGPVDHDVPVLTVKRDGKLIAVVFGYACHNTTMQYQLLSGDYAGFAQINLEKEHEGAVALFWAGCGGDQNPLPRSKIDLCKKYGKQLSDSVESVLAKKMTPVSGKLTAKYAEIALPFDTLPTKEKLTADTLSSNHALKQRAKKLLEVIKKDGKLDDHYRHYPVQAWGLGDQVTWLALGGEVVVDYSRRLKKEHAGKRTLWVTAYANDVMAYVPSARVLKEGGYEGDTSMIVYGQPAKWGPSIEKKIVEKSAELIGQVTK